MSTDPLSYVAVGFMLIFLILHSSSITNHIKRLLVGVKNVYLDWKIGNLTRKIAEFDALNEARIELTLDVAYIQKQSGVWSSIYTTEENGFINMSDNKNDKQLSLSIERDGMTATVYRYPLHQFNSLKVDCNLVAIEAGIKQQYELDH